jgi:hypothetical protein
MHEGVIQTLKDGYQKAAFFLQNKIGSSVKKQKYSGIRQECPLPPYLLIMVMTFIGKDIEKLLTPVYANVHNFLSFPHLLRKFSRILRWILQGLARVIS